MEDKLCLGVARENITPKIGSNLYGYAPDIISTAIHDDLTATAFYFTFGDTKAIMISYTLCSIKTEISDRIRSLIEEKSGIPKENCVIHSVHTHSGPNVSGGIGWGDIDKEYLEDILLPNTEALVKNAISSTIPVKMGIATGESYIGINRRQLKVDNRTKLGQNPWGPFDPTMTVISFVNEKNLPVANIVHYGMHGTCAGANLEISRDFSGVMIDELEAQSGAVTAFFNGPEGDVGPRLTNGYTTGKGDIRFAERHGALAASDAVRIYRKIKEYKGVELDVLSAHIDVPLDKRISLEEAKEKYQEFKEHTVNIRGKKSNYYKRQIEFYEQGYVDRETRRFEQTIVRLGPVAFVATPFELFSEIGMRVAVEKVFPYTLTLSNTNGSEGYFVTESEICRGGYEVDMFKMGYDQPYADNADWHFVTQTLENLNKIKGEEN